MDWLNAMNNAVEYMEANITEKLGVLGVSKDFDKYKDEFNYMIAVQETKDPLPKGYISVRRNIIKLWRCYAWII